MAQNWEETYRAAVLELDPDKLFDRIREAQAALVERLQQLQQSEIHNSERIRIEDAILILDMLRRVELGAAS